MHLLMHLLEEWNRRRLSACGPRNQFSSLERSREGWRPPVAWESSSGSDSGNANLPDGGSTTESSSPEPSSPSAGASTRWWAPPCPRSLSAHPGTPDGAMHWSCERPAETHSTGKLSLWSSSHPDLGVNETQHDHSHVPTMRTLLIHERCLSLLIAQARGTAIVAIR